MILEELFRAAESRLSIVGTAALIPHLENSARLVADLLTLNADLRITILCESDSELFSQSLAVDTPHSRNRMSFATMMVHRDRILGTSNRDGLAAEVSHLLQESTAPETRLKRLTIRQLHLRSPLNIIQADDRIWWCPVTHAFPTLESYSPVENEALRVELTELVEFYLNRVKGGIYLSRPGDELIELYDRNGYPRGIFPRACFYNTDFKRYSVWGFVFNRRGELLLHQRSLTTKDGRGLWDKSIGGHVDLRDSSTYITAQRELVEELFLPEAEYSKYIRADLGDIINFGDWNPRKRPERTFRESFAGLGAADWVMLRATDPGGNPLVVNRTSERRVHDDDDNLSTKRTVFISDVYLFIAPPDYLDTKEQMERLLGVSEGSGAALAHKLLPISVLRDWIADSEANQSAKETFTDDLLYINIELRGMLEGFAEFVRFVS